MHWFDMATIAITALAIAFGLWRGLVRIAFSVAAVVGGLLAARLFQAEVGHWLSGWMSPTAANTAAYLVLFVSTMVVIGLPGWLVTQILVLWGVNWINRLAGAGLGLIGGALVVSGLYAAAVVLLAPAGTTPLMGSVLAPYVAE
jgi:membrane protein required for colicin V production